MSERYINVRPLRVLFAGGGTGGHLFPAIAIAEEIIRLEPATEIQFAGTKDKIEARVVPLRGFRLRTIWISGFHRKLDARNIALPLKIIVSMFQARKILRDFRPDVVVGTGGYVSGPILRSAVNMNIPALIQEQNSYPGVTTRLLAGSVNEVHVTFEMTKKYLPDAKRVVLSGNPTRDSLEGASRKDAFTFFGFDESSKARTIFVFGGSLGAHSINKAMMRHLENFQSAGLRVIWQTGADDLEQAKQSAKAYPAGRIWIGAFIDRMEYAYAASDCVVARAGATTIAELTRLGKPAILVPYPHAAANHQWENARSLVDLGAAMVVDDHEVNEKLFTALMSLLDDGRLREMTKNSKSLGKPDAAQTIARSVITLGRSNMVELG